MNAPGTLFIISAPSGCGKSTLIKSLLQRYNYDNSMYLSISHTTREIREGEQDHVHYHFVDHQEFESLIEKDAFFEYAKVFDNYYGTSKQIAFDYLQKGVDVILDIDWQGARIIRSQTENVKSIFILPPSIEELEKRLVQRATDEKDVIEKRMQKAVGEISHYNEYDYVVVNDKFDKALMEIYSIICATRAKLDKAQIKYEQILSKMLQ